MQGKAAPVILQVQNLSVTYRTGGVEVHALQDASVTVREGEVVGLAGESGSGKSTLGRVALGLLPEKVARIRSGRIEIGGVDVTNYGESDWEEVRGSPIAMVFQDPLSFLNPVTRVGSQIAEGIRRQDPKADPRKRTLELLRLVKLAPETARRYPHELSGGMRQRIMLAIALGCRPRLLIADEPTTALDVTTQDEILALLTDICAKLDMSMLLISHDLSVLQRTCNRIYIMYAGHTIETGTTREVFASPAHPYTAGLIKASRLQRDRDGHFGAIGGDVPKLHRRFEICPFLPRCGVRMAVCEGPLTAFIPTSPTHAARCWRLDLETAVPTQQE